jgi:hypothetical protein
MRFIIENVTPQYIEFTVKTMRESHSLFGICIENIRPSVEWVQVGGCGDTRLDELRPVVSFEFPHFDQWDDVIMPVLTSYFENTGLIFSTPDRPGFRFQIA